ncbi:MAG: mechanosensitive ion channel family protein [Chloroflexi bacterium]|nr:mechanosensitive ion channel family protein [Chloroflexota bacterium]
MAQWLTDWLIANWLKIAVPVLAFLATYVVSLWLVRVLDNAFRRWTARVGWEAGQMVAGAVRRSLLFWFLLLGALIAIQVSVLSPQVKGIIGKGIGSLFGLSLGWAVIVLSEKLLKLYLPKMKAPQPTIALAINVVRVTIIVIGALIILEIWGMPTSPLLVLIAVAVLAAALFLRNAAPNLFSGFQLGATRQIDVGDYIKLETGEEGYVTEIGWSNIQIKGLDESIIIIPNSRLLQHTVINYGRPLKKAKEPFRFSSRTHLTELTGLKAKDLRQLVDILREAPDAVVYHHTHRFLQEYHYLTPAPSNDFAIWISDALGDEVLGETLASVDTFEFPNLGALRERLVGIIEEYLAKGSNSREAMPGSEFHFMKSVSVILPTHYVARDIREFVEALRKISLDALYFHMFESRLRLGRGLNDFSIWMQDSLGEAELGDQIARLDPYSYTLEALRLALIQLIEKRIK